MLCKLSSWNLFLYIFGLLFLLYVLHHLSRFSLLFCWGISSNNFCRTQVNFLRPYVIGNDGFHQFFWKERIQPKDKSQASSRLQSLFAKQDLPSMELADLRVGSSPASLRPWLFYPIDWILFLFLFSCFSPSPACLLHHGVFVLAQTFVTGYSWCHWVTCGAS